MTSVEAARLIAVATIDIVAWILIIFIALPWLEKKIERKTKSKRQMKRIELPSDKVFGEFMEIISPGTGQEKQGGEK